MSAHVLGMKWRPKRRRKPRTVTYHQLGVYLAQKNIPEPLIRTCVRFLEDQAGEAGEEAIGQKTIDRVLQGAWRLEASELEAIYDRNPSLIHQYVFGLTCDPDMPPLDQLTRSVQSFSTEAQRAYIFLSETAMRVVYGMLYEPDHVWKVVGFYDDEPIGSV